MLPSPNRKTNSGGKENKRLIFPQIQTVSKSFAIKTVVGLRTDTQTNGI